MDGWIDRWIDRWIDGLLVGLVFKEHVVNRNLEMAVSFFLCPSLSVILWGHVRLLGCPDVFSYLSAFQQVPSSPPPLSLFFPSFTLSLSLSLSLYLSPVRNRSVLSGH